LPVEQHFNPRAKTILVVDDEEPVRQAVCKALAREGYDVTAAPDGSEAILKLSEKPYDAIVLDMRMPGMSGFDLMYMVNKMFPDIIIVVLSAIPYRETGFADVSMPGGFAAYLEKPITVGRLRETLAQAFAASEKSGKAPPQESDFTKPSSAAREPAAPPIATEANTVGTVIALRRLKSLEFYTFKARPGLRLRPGCHVITAPIETEFNNRFLVGRVMPYTNENTTNYDVKVLYEVINNRKTLVQEAARPDSPVKLLTDQALADLNARIAAA